MVQLRKEVRTTKAQIFNLFTNRVINNLNKLVDSTIATKSTKNQQKPTRHRPKKLNVCLESDYALVTQQPLLLLLLLNKNFKIIYKYLTA